MTIAHSSFGVWVAAEGTLAHIGCAKRAGGEARGRRLSLGERAAPWRRLAGPATPIVAGGIDASRSKRCPIHGLGRQSGGATGTVASRASAQRLADIPRKLRCMRVPLLREVGPRTVSGRGAGRAGHDGRRLSREAHPQDSRAVLSGAAGPRPAQTI